MEFVDAFLLVSSLAYLWLVLLPYSATGRSKVLEIIGFAMAGGVIFLNTFYFDSSVVWVFIGAFYVLASLLSYLGYIEWRVRWGEGFSELAQMCMWAWDLAIAICCFMKLTF